MSLQISIITAVFNRARTLESAIRSVHGQDWPNVEHIVIDGGSTDGSMKIVEAHKARISKVVSERDSGLYDALNKGILHASGDIVGFMHADDEFASPHVLAKVA